MNKLEIVKEKFSSICNELNERTRRIWAACEAKSLGHGGITLVSKATGISLTTIKSGIAELKEQIDGVSPIETSRIRKSGGGRKPIEIKQENVIYELNLLVEPTTRGDPESPLRWTTKSTRNLSKALKEKGISISHEKVAALLKKQNYSLQAPRKTHEGGDHPDRDMQFEYVNSQTVKFQSKGYPVVSVDAKKKELIGRFKNGGSEYQPKGEPEKVEVYDFPNLSVGKVTPYGVYDIQQNSAWVNVGISKDTAQFAVSTLRNWWCEMGMELYKDAKELLIHADGGGSNGSRNRLWKSELQKFSNDTGLAVTVCHFPPGTSKWNKIEHRLFSQITKNWRGRPLESFEIIVNLIGSTTTQTGLTVKAILDKNNYESGIKISNEEFEQINIERHEFHGEDWNYTISPSFKQE